MAIAVIEFVVGDGVAAPPIDENGVDSSPVLKGDSFLPFRVDGTERNVVPVLPPVVIRARPLCSMKPMAGLG